MYNKIFTHGTIVNFYKSCREMNYEDLQRLVDNFKKPILFGKIDLENNEIFLYGHLNKLIMQNKIIFEYDPPNIPTAQKIYHDIDDLEISHEACFDIIVDEKKLCYNIIYISFYDPNFGSEINYFFAEDNFDNTLDYVVDFWEKVHDVGRDIDFTLTGCRSKFI